MVLLFIPKGRKKRNGRAALTSNAVPTLVDCANPPPLACPPRKRQKKSEGNNDKLRPRPTLLATVSDDTIPSTTAPPTSLAPGEVEAGEQMVVSDIVEDKTVGDCLQEEGLHYVAGWVIRVLQQEEVVQACPQCEVVLMGARDQDHNYAAASTNHPFLEAKKFTSTANLMKPSDNFFAAIQLLEGEFVRLINDFWPHKGITKKLESALFKLGAFNSLFRAHQEHASLLEAIAIKKNCYV
ncbi:uncharacterized protein LOC142379836 [Odontesthes bonariensis]|uniref:uncharacterized protein LOC142379836 n=1 Tax=Odontesthes bonariensis TaxID=219752 RepID=UPI003F5824D9